jgi:hypothetical protein
MSFDERLITVQYDLVVWNKNNSRNALTWLDRTYAFDTFNRKLDGRVYNRSETPDELFRWRKPEGGWNEANLIRYMHGYFIEKYDDLDRDASDYAGRLSTATTTLHKSYYENKLLNLVIERQVYLIQRDLWTAKYDELLPTGVYEWLKLLG